MGAQTEIRRKQTRATMEKLQAKVDAHTTEEDINDLRTSLDRAWQLEREAEEVLLNASDPDAFDKLVDDLTKTVRASEELARTSLVSPEELQEEAAQERLTQYRTDVKGFDALRFAGADVLAAVGEVLQELERRGDNSEGDETAKSRMQELARCVRSLGISETDLRPQQRSAPFQWHGDLPAASFSNGAESYL